MYIHNERQMVFSDEYPELFGNLPLDPNNRWIELSRLIPWVMVEDEYRKNFKKKGGEKAKPSRLALGCLIVKEQLQLSDRDTVEMIRENPYIQYFLGLDAYDYHLSLDASLLTHFRKRFPADIIAKVNRAIIEATLVEEDADQDEIDPPSDSGSSGEEVSEGSEDNKNKGTLILDATCAPQDIQYPTDVRLLHESRLKLEAMQDTLQAGRQLPKPRNYRQRAQKDYNLFCRNRHPSRALIRKAVRRQLSYVARDLRIVEQMQGDSTVSLSPSKSASLEIIKILHAQQAEMYDKRTHRIQERIVSLHQPYVRPIVRGKARTKTEFGAKLTVSLVDGLSEIVTLSWDAYSEGADLPKAIKAYKGRYGYYPERALADKAFRTRDNRKYCQERGIHLNGPPLGRPPNDRTIYDEQKRLERVEAGERNAIEGKFGEGKRRYSLSLVTTRLKETSETQIHLTFLVMNLKKILRDLFDLLFQRLFARFSWTIFAFMPSF